MHEKLKHLIKTSSDLFSLNYINRLSKNSGFSKRKGKLSAKIQLQYDLLTGTFTCCEIQEGITSDASYTDTMSNYISANDLSLADLGYCLAQTNTVPKNNLKLFH